MPSFLLLGTATDAGRPIIVQDASWLERHITTLKENGLALQQFYFMLGDVDVVFAVEARDSMAADRAAVALTRHGLLRVAAQRAYDMAEYQALIAPPPPPLEQLWTLDALQSRTKALVEHHTDSRITHLDDYSSAIVRTGGSASPELPADLVVGATEPATLKLADEISALGLVYQQGLFNATIEVDLADGTTSTFSASGFFPDQSFMGFVAQQPISGLVIRTQGDFYLEELFFYADHQIEPTPGVSTQTPQAVAG